MDHSDQSFYSASPAPNAENNASPQPPLPLPTGPELSWFTALSRFDETLEGATALLQLQHNHRPPLQLRPASPQRQRKGRWAKFLFGGNEAAPASDSKSSSSSESSDEEDCFANIVARMPLKLIDRRKLPVNLLPYNPNMARPYPGAENRTPEEQERRRKNSEAARKSRARNKLMQKVLEKRYQTLSEDYAALLRDVEAKQDFINFLLMKLGRYPIDYTSDFKDVQELRAMEAIGFKKSPKN